MLFRSCSLYWLQTLSLQIGCLVLREAQRSAQDHTAHFCPHTLWSSCILDPVTIQRVCLSLVNAHKDVLVFVHSSFSHSAYSQGSQWAGQRACCLGWGDQTQNKAWYGNDRARASLGNPRDWQGHGRRVQSRPPVRPLR